MLGVWSACLAAMARAGAADPKQSACGNAEAMPHPRENGRLERGKDHSRTELSASGTPVAENQNPLRWGRAARKAQRFAHVCARAKTSGLPLPLTREPPRRRRIGDTVTTERSISSTPHFDMETATLADFCLRPDETNHPSPAKQYRQSRRKAAAPDSRKQRREPMYADVVDVLATDAAGRKYGRRRCDDGAMYLGDFADDCLTREGWGMLVSLNGDT